jgi:hypothetical protein
MDLESMPHLDELVVCQSIKWEQGDFAERRAIDFFRRRTAPSVSSYFDADFVSPYISSRDEIHQLTRVFIRSGLP